MILKTNSSYHKIRKNTYEIFVPNCEKKLRMIPCDKCDLTFKTPDSMMKHFSSSHFPIKCDLCNARFSQEQYLKAHMETIHEDKKTFKCHL